jgi:hypothetical protein
MGAFSYAHQESDVQTLLDATEKIVTDSTALKQIKDPHKNGRIIAIDKMPFA